MPDGSPSRSAPLEVPLAQDGEEQVLRIPAEFALPGGRALLRREGERLVVEPAGKAAPLGLLELIKTWEDIDVPEYDIEDPPPEPIEFPDWEDDGHTGPA